MVKNLAWLISYLYHPLLMTSYLFILLTIQSPDTLGIKNLTEEGRWILMGLIFGLTFLFPMLLIIVLRFSNFLTDIEMSKRQERYWPMFLAVCCYLITTYLLSIRSPLGTAASSILIGILLTMIIITIITHFWKISAHSAGAWGGVGVLLAFQWLFPDPFLLYFLLSLIILAGSVSSARLYLSVHNLSQVTLGGLIGFVVCFLTVMILNS